MKPHISITGQRTHPGQARQKNKTEIKTKTKTNKQTKNYGKHDNNPTMNIMSQFNLTLRHTDLGYLFGIFHFHVSQNMKVFVKIAFSANKMVALWIF